MSDKIIPQLSKLFYNIVGDSRLMSIGARNAMAKSPYNAGAKQQSILVAIAIWK